MIDNIQQFKKACIDYLKIAIDSLPDPDDKNECVDLIRIINLINCDVICETDVGRAFRHEIDLNGVINILSVGGKIKKLSEVNFDEKIRKIKQ